MAHRIRLVHPFFPPAPQKQPGSNSGLNYYESMPTIRTKKPSQGTVFFFSIEDPTIIQQKGRVRDDYMKTDWNDLNSPREPFLNTETLFIAFAASAPKVHLTIHYSSWSALSGVIQWSNSWQKHVAISHKCLLHKTGVTTLLTSHSPVSSFPPAHPSVILG